MSAPVFVECDVCTAAQSVTVCDRCSRPICYACEASGGTAAQMLCIECRDQMAANPPAPEVDPYHGSMGGPGGSRRCGD